MAFSPSYQISNALLASITRINSLVSELNHRHFPHLILVEFEKVARAVSAYASTSIEGNPLPLTEVKKILKSQPIHIRDSEKEVLNYNQALHDLNTTLAKKNTVISEDFILHIQKQVTAGLLPKYESGHFRQKPVVVNNPKTGETVYLPPDASDVAPLMRDLITFVKNNQQVVDPLILAGIFHKQMVVIHPFMDGNGRTTRLATKVLLAEMGLNTFNLFSFENYYNQNVTKYFQMVGEYGNYYELEKNIDFTQWLEYFTEGIIDELLRVQALLPTPGIIGQAPLQPHHIALLNIIKEKGMVNEAEYAKVTNRAKATRVLDFQKLIDMGLIERKGKSRATYYTLKTENFN